MQRLEEEGSTAVFATSPGEGVAFKNILAKMSSRERATQGKQPSGSWTRKDGDTVLGVYELEFGGRTWAPEARASGLKADRETAIRGRQGPRNRRGKDA